jgi:uncharacterized protein
VAPVVATAVEGPARIGLIADTHGGIVDWDVVQPKVAPLFESVDFILHCGDVGGYEVLDALGTIAPVLALRNTEDPPPRGAELVDGTRVVDVGGTRVGVTFSLSASPMGADLDGPLSFPGEPASRVGELLFDGDVDVVVFGGTHQDLIALCAGILFVNPGSPSLADRTSVGILQVADGIVEARILPVVP